jgi:hypothetical protein
MSKAFWPKAVHRGHHAAGVEFRAQAVHLPAERLAGVQAVHAESGGQLEEFRGVVAVERIILRAEITTPRDVRARFHVQHDVGRHRRMIRAAMLRHDASKGGKMLRLRVRARLIGQIRGLHDHVRLVIAEAAIDGADERELVEHRRLLRQKFADAHAGQLGLDRLERPAVLDGTIWLRIPSVNVRGTAGHPQQDHRFVALRGLTFRTQLHQAGQSERTESCEARFQNGTPSMHHDTITNTRVHEHERVRITMT